MISRKPSSGKRHDKARKGKEAEIPDAVIAHRDRLHQTLGLGIGFDPREGRKWLSADAMLSSHAVKMMSGFIDHLSPKLFFHSIIKESVGDILTALEGILQTENETVLTPAVVVSTKLFDCLGSSLFQYRFCGVVSCLSQLLSSHQLPIVISSTKNLNSILRNVDIDSSRHHKEEIWQIFCQTNGICCIVNALQAQENQEDFLELVCLLKEIARIWPRARYSIWRKDKLMKQLGNICAASDPSVTSCVLQLYCALLHCYDVVISFVKGNKPFLSNLLQCMGSSMPHLIRVWAFRLCQQLVRSEVACLSLIAMCGEEIVQRIIDALGRWRLASIASVSLEEVQLVKEACHAAQMTRWIGEHQGYFWKNGIHKILFDILGCDDRVVESQGILELAESKKTKHCDLLEITNSILNILRYLSMNCVEEFFSSTHADPQCLNAVISRACTLMVDGMLNRRHFRHSSNRLSSSSMLLHLFRATLSLVFSPCKSIALQARQCLSGILKHHDLRDYLQYILNFFSHHAIVNDTMAYDDDVLLRLIALVCFTSLCEFQSEIIKFGGVGTLLIMLKTLLRRKTHLKRSSFSSCRSCCWYTGDNDVESRDNILLYILQALSQLIPLSSEVDECRTYSEKVSAVKVDNICGESIPDILMQVLQADCGRGVKWYSVYCLTSFGYYGFPSAIGRRMQVAINDTEWKDSDLVLYDNNLIGVHRVILLCRCPSLLPPKDPIADKNINKNSACDSSEELSVGRLSSRVEKSTLQKILEFVYMGFCQLDENDLQSVRVLARSCGLESLYQLLQRKLPVCTSPLPIYDLNLALSPNGHAFSDVILEAKETEALWSCNACKLSSPHVHAHKIILCSNSVYFHALFHSGMQESLTSTIKVPLSWIALVKLVHWFYSGELPELKFSCKWYNSDQQTQLDQLLVYLEISELSEIWCLDEVREKSIHTIVSYLKLNERFPIKIVQSAYNLRQYEVLEVALTSLAPLYNELYSLGELEEFDDELVELLREKYVLYSLEAHETSD